MVKMLVKAVANILGRPLILIPVLFAALANYFVMLFSFEAGANIVAGIVEFGLPNYSLTEMPLAFYSLNFWDINIVAIGLVTNLVITAGLLIFYARFVKLKQSGKPSIKSAFSYALSHIGTVIGALAVFALISIILLFGLWFILLLVLARIPLMDFVALAYVLFMGYIALKLVMVFTAIGFDGQNIKHSFQASWDFTTKKLFGTVYVLLLSTVVYLLLSIIGGIIMTPLADDFQVTAVYYFFSNILSGALAGLMLAEYYGSEKP